MSPILLLGIPEGHRLLQWVVCESERGIHVYAGTDGFVGAGCGKHGSWSSGVCSYHEAAEKQTSKKNYCIAWKIHKKSKANLIKFIILPGLSGKIMLYASPIGHHQLCLNIIAFYYLQLRRLWKLTSWVSWWRDCFLNFTWETGLGVEIQSHSESCSFGMGSARDSSRKWVWPLMSNNHIHNTNYLSVC